MIDLSADDRLPVNASRMPAASATKAWTRELLHPDDWTVHLPTDAVDELRRVAPAIAAAAPGVPPRAAPVDLPACRAVMAGVRSRLTDGPGLVVVDRLPLDDWSRPEAAAAFWTLGAMLAPPVATAWDGTVVYDVRDSGRTFGARVRGSSTAAELSFHTDNAFGVALPEFVGLLCIRPAQSGGVSRFCSLHAAHDRMAADHPQLLNRLYRPVYFDRQGEHAPDSPPVLSAPVMSWDGAQLRCRLVPGLVHRGYDLAGVAMDNELSEALEALEVVLADERLHVEFRLQRGQLQYVNNLEYGHYRSAFADGDTPGEGRHLLRMWHRSTGRPGYDG